MPNIDEILGGARDAITVRRVYGEPIEQEGMTVVPAAAVRGGGGGGGDSDGNGGGGFGVAARPVGAYVIRDGEVRLAPGRRREPVALGWQVVVGARACSWRGRSAAGSRVVSAACRVRLPSVRLRERRRRDAERAHANGQPAKLRRQPSAVPRTRCWPSNRSRWTP